MWFGNTFLLPHASKWLLPTNVALSVYAQVPPYSLEAVSSSASFPTSVNIEAFPQKTKRRLRHFFTTRSKEAPCIAAADLGPAFWRNIDNHNRFTERKIGALKDIINQKIVDIPEHMNRTDFRLRSYLCDMDPKCPEN